MKSDCKEYQEQIARWFLGDLTSEERRSLEEHLSECSVCASERERYAETIGLLKAAQDEPAPRHFFVHPEVPDLNPWQLFCRMTRRWQAATVAAAALCLLLGIAAISNFQMRLYDGNWTMGFGSGVDAAALNADLMQAIAERDEASATRIAEMREDIGGVLTDMASQQRATMTALIRQDALLDERITITENRLKSENRELVRVVYDSLTEQRVQDLGVIDLRLDSFENNYAVKELQTNQILSALLQEANRETQ
ncbi:MAG: zf-HC2 domain-containing protein [Acidobacteria bacterium]|nr:zf-HC2 domain-containing protein [Acidobacteriota bacterium]